MFHNEPLTEEERIAKLEKLRLSSSQFSLVSEDPIAEEARKLCENTAAIVKVGDKVNTCTRCYGLTEYLRFSLLDGTTSGQKSAHEPIGPL